MAARTSVEGSSIGEVKDHDMELILLLITKYIALPLAANQIVETWSYGSLFAERRQKLELFADRWWAQLLLCAHCLLHWVVLLLLVCVLLAQVLSGSIPWWGALLLFPLQWYAITWIAIEIYSRRAKARVRAMGLLDDEDAS